MKMFPRLEQIAQLLYNFAKLKTQPAYLQLIAFF
jgi:hypothetical protein